VLSSRGYSIVAHPVSDVDIDDENLNSSATDSPTSACEATYNKSVKMYLYARVFFDGFPVVERSCAIRIIIGLPVHKNVNVAWAPCARPVRRARRNAVFQYKL